MPLPILPLPMPPPLPHPPPLPPLPSLDPDATLRDNLVRIVGTVTQQPLSDATRRAIDEALQRGLDLLDATARPLLRTRLLDALMHWAGAQLHSQVLEALPPSSYASGDPVEDVLGRLLRGCACAATVRCPAPAFAEWLDEDALATLASEDDGSGRGAYGGW